MLTKKELIMNKLEKINKISIPLSFSILDALKKMDQENVKLLIILDKGKFAGLLTIGDIQRAIIKDIPIMSTVDIIKRDNIHIARKNDNLEEIKINMLKGRDECMPIVDENNVLIDAIFWEDLFQDIRINKPKLNIPVVIMAGGIGSRMKPLTNIIPKPLIPIGENTISEIIMNKYHEIGITHFYMSVNYKSDMIKIYFRDKKNCNYQLDFFEEDIPLGTAGSISLLKEKINTTFFVNNCDIIIDQDYREIYDYHKESNNDITVVSAIKSITIPYGTIVSAENGKLIELKEKPNIIVKINTGMYLLEPYLIDEIPKKKMYHITELINKIINKGGRVGVFPISDKQYYDIGEWSYYKNTLETLNSKNFFGNGNRF